MNHGISILFRVIPVVMAFICFFLGGFIFLYGDDGARQVAGPVVFFLGAICLALFATAATIIRQLIHKFHTVLKYIIPGFGYVVACNDTECIDRFDFIVFLDRLGLGDCVVIPEQ